MGQPDHEAQRVDLEFALPHPRRHLGHIGGIPVPVIGRFIERVGVRIDQYILRMALDQPADNPLQISIFRGKRHIMNDLLH